MFILVYRFLLDPGSWSWSPDAGDVGDANQESETAAEPGPAANAWGNVPLASQLGAAQAAPLETEDQYNPHPGNQSEDNDAMPDVDSQG